MRTNDMTFLLQFLTTMGLVLGLGMQAIIVALPCLILSTVTGMLTLFVDFAGSFREKQNGIKDEDVFHVELASSR